MNETLEAIRGERAERRVKMFLAEFGASYEKLACHAALPLVLTPELVNYLRNEFLRGEEVPWIAEVDLLLSDLCNPVGYELYAMDADVRSYLLEKMEAAPEFGRARMQRVAKLLVSYVRYLAEQKAQVGGAELEAQQWAAMVFLGQGERQKVAQEIAAKFQQNMAAVEQVGTELVSRAELARLAQLTRTFAPQLAEYQVLVDWAVLVTDVVSGRETVSRDRIERDYEVLPGVSLALAERLVPAEVKQLVVSPQALEPSQAERIYKTLEFETVQLVEAGASGGLELQTEQFTVATVEFEDNGLERFDFETATIVKQEQKQGFLQGLFNRQQQAQWVIQKQQASAYRFTQPLAEDVALEMVAIPGGRFLMGSPKDETDNYGSEQPQHEVGVEPFFLGRYPVTQAQWRAVAAMDQIERELKADPSNFKGDDRPVEQVSWEDAQEFCARLSREVEREYRLPNEAEWEYACRAGTTTPFHFGETVTTDLANYDGSAYGDGPKGKNREKTTDVGQFPANAWGLQDMHGNVYEWCDDDWHENYEGAPDDGSAWIREESEELYKLRRGGSWLYDPGACRSACRNRNRPSFRDYHLGFRVACVAPRAV